MMLSIIFSKKKQAYSFVSSSDDQGLKTLTKLIPNGGINSNQLVINPFFQINHKSKTPSTTLDDDYCFLNSCHLCHKHLSLNKEIYMYRGDLGFCSLECRDRQIYLDETKEIEISTQKILASFRQRRCEDYRSSRPHPLSSHKSRVIFS